MMSQMRRTVSILTALFLMIVYLTVHRTERQTGELTLQTDIAHEISPPLSSLSDSNDEDEESVQDAAPIASPVLTTPPGAERIEQLAQGQKPAATLVASFDGLGAGFQGPQGTASLRNPSDNSLAVGPDHIMQTVNTRMAIFTKKGRKFDSTGKVLYGPVPNNTVFKGFGGACEATNNGDTVIRYDQLAGRWLIVMPIFRRGAVRPDQPQAKPAAAGAQVSVPGKTGQPGEA